MLCVKVLIFIIQKMTSHELTKKPELRPKDIDLFAEEVPNMASMVLRCFISTAKCMPVIFITAVIVWSYYAYVIQMCLCKCYTTCRDLVFACHSYYFSILELVATVSYSSVRVRVRDSHSVSDSSQSMTMPVVSSRSRSRSRSLRLRLRLRRTKTDNRAVRRSRSCRDVDAVRSRSRRRRRRSWVLALPLGLGI